MLRCLISSDFCRFHDGKTALFGEQLLPILLLVAGVKSQTQYDFAVLAVSDQALALWWFSVPNGKDL
jgi:hypothetical protein